MRSSRNIPKGISLIFTQAPFQTAWERGYTQEPGNKVVTVACSGCIGTNTQLITDPQLPV